MGQARRHHRYSSKDTPRDSRKSSRPKSQSVETLKVSAISISVIKHGGTKLKIAMEESNIKKWTTNNGTQITLVADGEDKEVMKFDETLFKKEDPETYAKYQKLKLQKGRSGYIKITLPK